MKNQWLYLSVTCITHWNRYNYLQVNENQVTISYAIFQLLRTFFFFKSSWYILVHEKQVKIFLQSNLCTKAHLISQIKGKAWPKRVEFVHRRLYSGTLIIFVGDLTTNGNKGYTEEIILYLLQYTQVS